MRDSLNFTAGLHSKHKSIDKIALRATGSEISLGRQGRLLYPWLREQEIPGV